MVISVLNLSISHTSNDYWTTRGTNATMNQDRTQRMPLVTQQCIKSQWSVISRTSPKDAYTHARKLLKRENPELGCFLDSMIELVFSDDDMPIPLQVHLHHMVYAHCGIMYRILRAQLEADVMAHDWPVDAPDWPDDDGDSSSGDPGVDESATQEEHEDPDDDVISC